MRVYLFPLAAGLLLLCPACDKVCDTDNLPQYPLTPGLRAWVDPYAKGAVLRFRNAGTGYVRSYRVTEAEGKMDGAGSGVDPCPAYYREYATRTLERTDSTGKGAEHLIRFYLAAQNSSRTEARLSMGFSSVEPPLQQIENGTQALAPATFAGRTYPAVWCNGPFSPGSGSRAVVLMCLTKADGLIRFEERNGTAWDRL
ncbi:hypothetical protein [Hymenobacter yonginensis]|uniref:NigD-like C-terminal beta sandwich domain-containing protein n=1 Tax=Hymenobacter yonginensis TaxID=748197 RepID=A0ABY7PVC4_9BACT|nr:hypothetical protein [Hymenobacter yonginensis]WBO86804.1 hypothetical protein O9Z63_20180 [Hymenobacter yonginensis]